MHAHIFPFRVLVAVVTLVAAPAMLFAQKDASRVFGDIKYMICSARPKDAAQWRESMRTMGLLPMPGAQGQTPAWSMVSTTGEVRAEGLYPESSPNGDLTFSVRYFPYSADPAPSAILEWLLAQQGILLEDGDAVDVPLPTVTPCQGAVTRDSAMVSLSTGRLVRMTFSATWPKK